MTTTSIYEHDKLVEMTAAHMVNSGHTRVRASHSDRFTICDQIGDYIPDATALSNGLFVVAEAESHDGLA
ncbi:MAG: hypothetical protein ACRYFS_05525, partial [Janthinobacterium lividum]